jgi:hypothetical protein
LLIINNGQRWIGAMDNHQIQIGDDDQIIAATSCAGKGVPADFYIGEEPLIQRDPPEHPIAAAAPTARIRIGLHAFCDPPLRNDLCSLPLPLPQVEQAKAGEIAGGEANAIPRKD